MLRQKSQDSIATTATKQDNGATVSEFRGQARHFSFTEEIQTDTKDQAASSTIATRGFSLGVKRPQRDADHPLSTGVRFKTIKLHL